MAINIPHNTVADHIVFDRIVDADRTINLARTAAEKAEAAGKHDVADKLRAKADALEKILLATQHPEYEDEDEDTGEATDPTTSEENTESQGQGSTDSSQESSPEENKTTEEPSATSSSSTENTDSKSEDEGDGKTPEDIKKMNTGDSGTGDHSDGTQKIGPAGSSNAAEGEGGGGSGGDSKPSQGQSKNNNNKNKSKELDPFKRGGSGMGSQHQPTPEEIMAAVIKRLSSLSGNAKAGADRALKQLFGELGGIGEIDD